MKVWTSNYRDHWLSPYTILEKVFFWREIDYDEPVIERWSNRLEPFCKALQWIGNTVYPRWTYVKLDYWDTWSFDHTLADIILPGLRQLQATKHGAPFVDDEDVPEELRSTSAPAKENEWDTDSNHFKRWDWVLDEMIWAFEQKVNDEADSQFFDHSECGDIKDFLKNPNEHFSKTKYDREGHEAWQKRKANGFRLFGKYYEALWD